MLLAALLALSLAAPAQSPADPAPPAPLDAAPAPVDAAPADPSGDDVPVVPLVETPLRPEEIPPAPDAPPPPPPAPPDGLDPLVTGLVQAGVGTGLAGAFTAASYVLRLFGAANPFLGTIATSIECMSCLLVPGAVAVLETSLGDAWSKKRAAALVPTLAAYGACCVQGIVQTAVALVFVFSKANEVGAGDPVALTAALAQDPAFQITNIVLYIAGPVMVGTAPAIAYAIVAEDKKPGDAGGLGMPGFVTPAHPAPAPLGGAKTGVVTAMRY